MLNVYSKILSKNKKIWIIILLMNIAATQQAQAKNLDAGFVLNGMTSDQQVSYVEGAQYRQHLTPSGRISFWCKRLQ